MRKYRSALVKCSITPRCSGCHRAIFKHGLDFEEEMKEFLAMPKRDWQSNIGGSSLHRYTAFKNSTN